MIQNKASQSKVDILLIDDTPSNLLALEVILECSEYNLISVGSGRQALAYLAQHDVALILTDVMMPIMDGFELAAHVKKDPRLSSIPIIFLTAMAKDVDQVFKGYTSGAVDYIQKPLTEEIVRAKVKVFADLYRQKQSLREAQAELLRLNHELRETIVLRTSALSDSENRLQLAVEAASFGMWDFFPPTLEMQGSFHFKRLLGLPSDADLDFDVFMESLHPEDRERTRAHMLHPQEEEIEYRVVRSGEERWLRSRGKAYLNDSGYTIRFIGMAQDITTRKRSELKLQEQASLLELTSDAIMARDMKHRVVFWNKSAESTYGWTQDEALGQNLHELLRTDFPVPIENVMEQLFALGRWEGELVHSRRNGERLTVSSRWALQRDAEGKPCAVLETSSDITQKKLAELELKQAKENAEAANLAKTAFLANMSHEIRTPLGAILGFSELLREPNLSRNEKTNFIDTISRNGRQLSQLIDEILDLSKIEAGRLETEAVEICLPALLSEVMSSLSVKAKEKAIAFTIEPEGNIPEYITSDPTRLRQILFNIIGNAIKFTHKGQVRVGVKLEQKEGFDRLVFTIADTGIGINSESQGKLFQTFVQADASTTRKFGGTGLGLVLSQKLARALGGDLWLLQSKPGAGSSFAIAIAIGNFRNLTSNIEGMGQMEGAPNPIAQSLRGLNILLAEDQLDNQFLITRILTKNGAHVDLVENGVDVVQRAMAAEYDVILMDMQMPLQDGYDSTRELRHAGYTKPIIALTAHALREEREKSLRAGCDDHLAKPISHQALISILRHYSGQVPDLSQMS